MSGTSYDIALRGRRGANMLTTATTDSIRETLESLTKDLEAANARVKLLEDLAIQARMLIHPRKSGIIIYRSARAAWVEQFNKTGLPDPMENKDDQTA